MFTRAKGCEGGDLGRGYVLEKLYEDDVHEIGDSVAAHLTYEEVIGALLLARDTLDELERLNQE